MKTSVVVDLGFGDSGKGITVDSLCIDSPNTIVVRYAGGQQCGHTVYLDETRMHIHSNYGSGTLRGIPSMFSEHCTMYLNTMVVEHNELIMKGQQPKLFMHPLAIVTTPFDVAYNRACSETRRHGTVGLGVGATMKRHLTTGHKLHAVDFLYPELFKVKLDAVKMYYESVLMSANMRSLYRGYLETELKLYESALNFVPLLFKVQDYSILKNYDHVIFEGSQGVMLDMDHGTFPNVTYARTTARNAEEIMATLRDKYSCICNTTYYLVARAYTTRHGNGWLPKEGETVELVNNHMEINEECEYQGVFRTAPYNPEMVDSSIRTVALYSDIKLSNSFLIITCLDQVNYGDDEDENRVLGLEYKVNPTRNYGDKIITTIKRRSHISSRMI